MRDRSGRRPRRPGPWSLRAISRLVIWALVLLLVAGAAIAVVGRNSVAASTGSVQHQYLPALLAGEAVSSAYGDEQAVHEEPGAPAARAAGVRAARQRADVQAARLARLLPDPASVAADRSVRRAVTAWRAHHDPRAYLLLRHRLQLLRGHLADVATARLGGVAADQRVGTRLGAVVIALGFLVAALAAVVMRRFLVRPAGNLVRDVAAVAAGRHDQPVRAGGARELAEIADAVEKMRLAMLEHSTELARTEQARAQQAEQDRISGDLHARTLRSVFALGLQLQKTALRHPDLRESVQPLVQDTDEIIRELRRIIFAGGADGTALGAAGTGP